MNITGQKLTHMIHAEDLILQGKEGFELALNSLKEVYKFLKKEESTSHITLKVDGSVSIVAATDYYGTQFVATKGFFNKNPKYATSLEECDELYGDTPGLNEKLKTAFLYLPLINIPKNEVWQGDFLFIKDSLVEQNINGINYITFLPNTILYAVPEDSPLYNVIKNSYIGIVWHTRYRGYSKDTLSISFDIKASELSPAKGAYMVDPGIPDFNYDVFNDEEKEFIDESLHQIENSNIEELSDKLISYINQYRNYTIKKDKEVSEEGLIEFINSLFDKELLAKKTDKGKASVEERRNNILNEIDQIDIENIFNLQNHIINVKNLFISKLDNLSQIKTFVQYNDGRYEQVGQEGYAVSDKEGNVQKYVNRRQFSRNNFNPSIRKGWTSYRRESQIKESTDGIKRNKEDEIKVIDDFLDQFDFIKVRGNISISTPGNTEYDARAFIEPVEDEDRTTAAENTKEVLDKNLYKYSYEIYGKRPVIIVEILREDNSILVFRMDFKDKISTGKRGTKNTEFQEVLWAQTSYNYMTKGINEVSIGDLNAAHVDKGWKKAIEDGNEAIIKSGILDPNKEYYVCRGSYSTDSKYQSIHPWINNLNRKLGIKDINVWNPSDIYVVVKDRDIIMQFAKDLNELENNNSSTVDDFNKVLLDYLNNKDIIGISLKFSINPIVDRMGYGSNKEEKTESASLLNITMPLPVNNPIGKTSSPVVTFIKDKSIYDIFFRSFKVADFGLPIAETREKGKRAMSGKFPADSYRLLLRSVGINSNIFTINYYFDKYLNEAINTCKSYINDIHECNFITDPLGNKINLESFEELINQTDFNNRMSVFKLKLYCSYIVFLELFIKYNKEGSLEKLLLKFLKGSSKDMEDSAPYYIVH